ncbi:hypothetical protein H2203_006884 [Taxawa tesnikishii (nom. ined.)]|nr:hypothetical protein H2203_006884 [Dothideales sp. JES 119]
MAYTLSVEGKKGSGQNQRDYDFSESQPWLSTRRALRFIDETQELISIYEDGLDPELASRHVESLENSAFTAYNSPAAANDAEGSRHKASEAAETPATVTSATVPQNPGVVSRVNWHSPFAASPADSPGHNLHQSANTYSTPPVALPDTGGVLQGSYHGPAPGLGFQSTVSIPHGLGPLLQPISEPSPDSI